MPSIGSVIDPETSTTKVSRAPGEIMRKKLFLASSSFFGLALVAAACSGSGTPVEGAGETRETEGGGSPIGGQYHFKMVLFADEIGVDPTAMKWVAYDGGGEAQSALLSGEIQVASLDVSESTGNEDIRILTVMFEERVPGLDGVSTTIELGYEVTFPIWRGLLAPSDMSDEAYDFWVDALGKVEASEKWKATGGKVDYENKDFLVLNSKSLRSTLWMSFRRSVNRLVWLLKHERSRQ